MDARDPVGRGDLTALIAAWRRAAPHLPYLIAAGVILFLLLCDDKFWLTNDDIRMSMAVGGYGIAASPSPGLGMGLILQTNVVWGWLLEHVPDVAHIRGYTLATYSLLLVTAVVIGAALHRRRVPAWFTAAVLVSIYSGAVLLPQFTLLAGYLAVAGFALVLASDERNLKLCLPAAAILLILSGLVRPDELVLVFMVISPLLVHAWLTHDKRWRLHWLGTAVVCALLLAAAFLYNLHYNTTGAWAGFTDIDSLRGQFTDYGLGTYFVNHPGKLAGSAVSVNDVKLIRSWFYLDPKVYNSANFAPLVHSVTFADRYALNVVRTASFMSVFESLQFRVLLALFFLSALLNWRRALPEAISLLLLLAFIVLIALWGRPGIERIYQPVGAGMLVLALLKLGRYEGRWVTALGIAALAAALSITVVLHMRSSEHGDDAPVTRAGTCASLARLPHDQLLLVWSGDAQYKWKVIYQPTTPDDDACDPPLYAIGSYQLAPPSLERLYAYTGGKNLIEALLAGQKFYIISTKGRLMMLGTYLQEHYHSGLQWQRIPGTRYFQLFTIQATPAS
jgi:hypothetical protein